MQTQQFNLKLIHSFIWCMASSAHSTVQQYNTVQHTLLLFWTTTSWDPPWGTQTSRVVHSYFMLPNGILSTCPKSGSIHRSAGTTESQQIKGQKPSIFKAQPVFCICSKNIERVKCNEALDKAALAARQFLNFHAPFRSWALAESLPKSHRRRSMNKVLSVAWWQMKPSPCTAHKPRSASCGAVLRDEVFTVISSESGLAPLRAAGPVPALLLGGAAGSSAPGAATGGRCPAIRRLGQLSAPRAAIEPPGRPFPSSPQRRAPGTWEHRPRGDGRPCPPRAEPPGHGQPLSTRAAASHLSPRKLPAQRPAACRPVGPAGRLSRRLRLSLGPCPAATTP